MKKLLSEVSVSLIKVLLAEPKIAEKVMENHADKDKYKICTVREDGLIILGKTSFRWWNQLIGCQDKIPFEAFALRVWDALVDLSSGLNNTAITEGLSKEIAKKAQREAEYDWVVNRLFDVARHVCQNGLLAGEPNISAENHGNGATREVVGIPSSQGIVININGTTKKVIPFVDSIGDPLIDLEFGITNVHCRNRG